VACNNRKPPLSEEKILYVVGTKFFSNSIRCIRAFPHSFTMPRRARNDISLLPLLSARPVKRRSRAVYTGASDAALVSAGGYRSVLGNPYTTSVLARKSGTSGFVDLNISQDFAANANQVHFLATVAQGTTTQERIGRKLIWKSIQMRGDISPSLTSTAHWDKCIVMIVYDNMPTGALPTAAEILETSDPNALNNENGFDRFKILKRMEWIVVGNQSATVHMTDRSVHNIKKFIKLNKPARYGVDAAGVAGTVAGTKEGCLYAVVLGRHNAATTLNAYLDCSFRVRFQDVLS